MYKDNLKMFAQCYVESQDVNEKNKQLFFNFINESDEHQIINFIMTGKPEVVTKNN